MFAIDIAIYCNCKVKLLKLKANYNILMFAIDIAIYCNCEVKLLKLKANYNYALSKKSRRNIVIAR